MINFKWGFEWIKRCLEMWKGITVGAYVRLFPQETCLTRLGEKDHTWYGRVLSSWSELGPREIKCGRLAVPHLPNCEYSWLRHQKFIFSSLRLLGSCQQYLLSQPSITSFTVSEVFRLGLDNITSTPSSPPADSLLGLLSFPYLIIDESVPNRFCFLDVEAYLTDFCLFGEQWILPFDRLAHQIQATLLFIMKNISF